MTSSSDSTMPINSYNAAGGIVVFAQKVLVLYRQNRNDIRLPKGHIEEGETPLEAARREIGEESGYTGLRLLADLGTQLVEFERNGKHTVRTEHYFLMEMDVDQAQIDREPDRKPLWLSWDEAVRQLTYEVEKEWVRRAKLTWK